MASSMAPSAAMSSGSHGASRPAPSMSASSPSPKPSTPASSRASSRLLGSRKSRTPRLLGSRKSRTPPRLWPPVSPIRRPFLGTAKPVAPRPFMRSRMLQTAGGGRMKRGGPAVVAEPPPWPRRVGRGLKRALALERTRSAPPTRRPRWGCRPAHTASARRCFGCHSATAGSRRQSRPALGPLGRCTPATRTNLSVRA